MSAAEFAHLHVSSGFSMRDGTATPQALVERAAQHRQPILALTDRDGLWRVLVHASGFRQSPYADTRPPGEDVRGSHRLGRGAVVPDAEGAEKLTPPRKLWHSSPGSSGH